MPPHSPLTKDNWLAAGFRALAQEGAHAIKAERLARDLKTTKGSFYWHFADVAAFKAAMLSHWEQKAATDIMKQISDAGGAHQQFQALIDSAINPAPEIYGGDKIEHAVRAWGLSDQAVAKAIAKVDKQRVGFLAEILKNIGWNDPDLATALYALHIGLDDLSAKHGHDKVKPFVSIMSLVAATNAEKSQK